MAKKKRKSVRNAIPALTPDVSIYKESSKLKISDEESIEELADKELEPLETHAHEFR